MAPNGTRGDAAPYGCSTGSAQQRADVPEGWPPPLCPAGDEGRYAGSSCPTGGCGEPPRLPGPAAHSGASAPAGAKKWVGIAAEITPKRAINAGQSLSQPAADSSLYTREPLGTGGYGLPRRFAPRNDSPDPLSFRGGPTGRRGNPSFLRWTVVRAAEVVGPYGRSTEVPATGRCGHRPLRNKTGACRDCQGSALSAERGAGQIQVLPDTLRVQHGVPCPEASARLRPCSRRGCVD